MKNYILIDAHIHFHEQYDITDFFSNAFVNFKGIRSVSKNDNYQQVLCFTESFGDDVFTKIKNSSNSLFDGTNYNLKMTNEDNTIVLSDGENDLILIAGRQIVTKENLEVLALGMNQEFNDGKDIIEVLNHVINSKFIPIIPWGVGKWFSKRKDILKKIVFDENLKPLFLGDNGNRPWFWSKPNLFQLAVRKNIFNLPGSDPLPFKSEIKKPGSFGSIAEGNLDENMPYNSLYEILLKSNQQFNTYGKLETGFSFLKNQVSMQIVKRIR